MITKNRESIHIVPEPQKSELISATYGIIGCMQQVHNLLGPGLPEYIYQEALTKELTLNGFTVHKEQQFHPTFRGNPMDAYLKMDLVVTLPTTKVIKKLQTQTKALFVAVRAGISKYLLSKRNFDTCTRIIHARPIAILVNFGTSPKARIERYYNDNGTIMVY